MHESSNDISYELQQLSGWLYDGRGGYSLGYLLRKLPTEIEYEGTHYDLVIGAAVFDGWQFDYRDVNDGQFTAVNSETPEDAACKLAIELFKQGVLNDTNTSN